MNEPSIACPRCDRSPLQSVGAGYRCAGCNVAYPSVDGIPWLFAEPAAALGEWHNRTAFLLRRLEHDRDGHRAAEAACDTPLGKRRLASMAAALDDHIAELRGLLAPLAHLEPAADVSTYLALRTKLPIDQGLMTYYANVHRDWAWGDAENELSADIVTRSLGEHAPERMLVLGAGAGRLCYDLHERSAATATTALDFNPLLMILARRIAGGESIALHEFPIAPRDLEQCAVLRTLSAPRPARRGLAFMLADAHRPPFAAKGFDTVITPWLVDILPEDFATTCARINHLLADDGVWVNFGSLSFHGSDPAGRLSPEECAEIVAATGFAKPVMRNDEIPYMCSPASRHGRRELVLSWGVRKTRHIKKVTRHEALPDWLVRGKEPVPAAAAFRAQAMSTRIHAFIMSLIDGRRTIGDMAELFEQQKLMRRDEAEPAIRSFLIKMVEDARRAP